MKVAVISNENPANIALQCFSLLVLTTSSKGHCVPHNVPVALKGLDSFYAF
jgi:hypothetical protein